MATMKYLNESGEWVDYVEQKSGILRYNGTEWVDGASDELSPPVAVSVYDGAKFVQFYPSASITYQHTFKASNLKYTHTKNSSSWGTSSPLSAIGGVWESGAIYTGWLGITKPSSLPGGISNVDEIKSITAKYTRRGIGNWEEPQKINLISSTLTSATGTGTNAHNSKRGYTFFSDADMKVCTATNQLVSGTTTFNNYNAKYYIKELMKGTYNSILLGSIANKSDYQSLTDLELTVTYTCKVLTATFMVKDEPMLASMYTRKKQHQMYIYQDEVGMSYEEIMKHREKNNIKDIKSKDVNID